MMQTKVPCKIGPWFLTSPMKRKALARHNLAVWAKDSSEHYLSDNSWKKKKKKVMRSGSLYIFRICNYKLSPFTRPQLNWHDFQVQEAFSCILPLSNLIQKFLFIKI